MLIEFFVRKKEYIIDRILDLLNNTDSNRINEYKKNLVEHVGKTPGCSDSNTGYIKINLPGTYEYDNKDINKFYKRLTDVIFHESIHSILDTFVTEHKINIYQHHEIIREISMHLEYIPIH